MEFNKRASTGLVVRKLILIVVLIVVLFAIYVGTSSTFKPLRERLSVMYDEVLIMLHINSDGLNGSCTTTPITMLTEDGDGLLNGIGVLQDQYDNTNFVICTNQTCILEAPGVEDYMLQNKTFYRSYNGKWNPAKKLIFPVEENELRFYLELYEGSIEHLLEKQNLSIERNKVNNFNKKGLRILIGDDKERLLLYAHYGDRSIGLFDLYGGTYTVEKYGDGVLYQGGDMEAAVEKFYSFTDVWWDPKVTGYLGDKEIGFKDVGGKDNEFDSRSEVKSFKIFLKGLEDNSLAKSRPSSEDIKKLVSGDTMVVDGRTFGLSVETDPRDGYPVLVMTSGNAIYGLRFSSDKSGVWGMADWSDLGLFQKKEKSWVEVPYKNFYKIPKEDFDRLSAENKIYEFLVKKCG